MRIVAARTEESAQLLFDREIETIECRKIAALVRHHQLAQRVVLRIAGTRR